MTCYLDRHLGIWCITKPIGRLCPDGTSRCCSGEWMGAHMSEQIPETEQRGTGTDDYDLVSVVVEYEERPNQCTIYPSESTEIERMSTWISADIDCYVDLDAVR